MNSLYIIQIAMGNCGTSKHKSQNPGAFARVLEERRRISKATSMPYHDVTNTYRKKKSHIETSVVNVKKVYDFETKPIGVGHFGSVVIAKLKKPPFATFAAKIIKKDELKDEIDVIVNEINIMRDTDHPHIVKFCETYSAKDRLFIIMEYLSGDTLKQYLKSKIVVGEAEAKKIVFQMCLALNHLHEKAVAHRDVKLENFLFMDKDGYEIKLIDFGLAKIYNNALMNSHIGTPYYAPPEILKNEAYDERCDEWSLGVCVYKILTGHYPFAGKDAYDLFSQITSQRLNERPMVRLSRNARDFIKSLLTKNPAKRKRVSDLLHHPWLVDYHVNFCQLHANNIDPAIFENIRNAQGINTFGIQLLKILVTFFPPPKDYNSAISAFFNADYSLTGFIAPKGLVRFFNDHGQELSDADARSITKSLAFYEEGFLTFTEFLVAAIDRQGWIIGQDLIPKVFGFLDVDDSSVVTVDDLIELFKRFGYQIERTYIKELINFMGEDALENGFDLSTFTKFVHGNFFLSQSTTKS